MEFRFERGKSLSTKKYLPKTEIGTQLCNHEFFYLLEVTNTQKNHPRHSESHFTGTWQTKGHLKLEFLAGFCFAIKQNTLKEQLSCSVCSGAHENSASRSTMNKAGLIYCFFSVLEYLPWRRNCFCLMLCLVLQVWSGWLFTAYSGVLLNHPWAERGIKSGEF